MGAPLRCSVTVLLFSCSAVAQVAGDFYLDKTLFAPGEPVFLHFQATNNGKKSANILQADPETFCSGYKITLSTDPRPGAHSSCATGFAGDCLSSYKTLKPDETQTENILLNFQHEIGNPGDYEVEAERVLPYADAGLEYFKAAKKNIQVRSNIYFRVDANLSVDRTTLQPFIDQLHSPDADKRREAARTLASVAPIDLESTFLAFADNPEFRQFAPLAFHHLSTPRSMQAMAGLLTKANPGTYENMESARYLSESGDLQWFPLLKEISIHNAKIVNYVTDAAQLGEERMLPVLLNLLTSPDKQFTRVNAISGLGYTNSRDAVPILINRLRDSDTITASFAEAALRTITHHTAYENENVDTLGSQSIYTKWAQWWEREGTTAKLYKGNDCGNITPLP